MTLERDERICAITPWFLGSVICNPLFSPALSATSLPASSSTRTFLQGAEVIPQPIANQQADVDTKELVEEIASLKAEVKRWKAEAEDAKCVSISKMKRTQA
jgi:hypothetical protein